MEEAAARPALTLLQARHQLDEIARLGSDIELMDEDLVPGVLARAGRTR